jgi:hypothetical protein
MAVSMKVTAFRGTCMCMYVCVCIYMYTHKTTWRCIPEAVIFNLDFANYVTVLPGNYRTADTSTECGWNLRSSFTLLRK